ncbi:HEAT repeat domain-containing protein [Nonomuraea sp. bgisy101]|uniref:HEAT repeat domain-containing protein n=1 Tax=Nonomuraea sp. bgisy101 TaxID=3413784 RepID=UPI003D72D4D2
MGVRMWLQRFVRHEETPGDPVVDVIRRLVLPSAQGHRHACDDLARALFGVVCDGLLAEEALDVLTTAGPTIWIELDPALRPWAYGYRDSRVAAASAVPQPSNALAVALAACSRDGREREAALRHPLMGTDVRLLPVLAIRTVDWVPAVRRHALRVMAEVLIHADAAMLRALVPVTVRLLDRQRGDSVTELVRQALLRTDDETLSAVRRCEDLRGRRFAYTVSLEAGRMDLRRLTAAALGERDIVSRTRCAEVLAAQALAGDRPELVEELLDSGSARVRVEALTALVRLGRTAAGERFLADEASLMRLTAQWAVRRAGGDPAELYRQRLAPPAGRGARGLLAGLGDCGTRSDADLALAYLRDPRPRVRAEAVRVLRRLGARADLADLLEDPAPVVVRNVVDAIRAAGPGVPAERLWALLGEDRPRHVRQAAHRLLTGRDAWTRIRADLVLAGGRDEALVLRARADLAVWCARDAATTYQRCPDELRAHLLDLLARAEHAVGEGTARTLRWVLGTLTAFAGVFDIHLTVAAGDDAVRLARWARANGVKFTHIVLARGEAPSQPMLTLAGRGTLSEQRSAAADCAARLRAEGFTVVRVKIEAAPWNADVPQEDVVTPGRYFEHHVKVVVRDDLIGLAELAQAHAAHVSRNARRRHGDGVHERFVTQRCRDVGLPAARRRFDALLKALESAGFAVLEAEQEFVVDDDNPGIDHGWIEER